MTWNPVTGCSKISRGCKNCYAERLAYRLQAMGNKRYVNGFSVTLHEDLINLPRKWRSPRTIFVNSMSDLFHELVPDSFIKRIFKTMNDCPQHTFQILTKRSERLSTIAASLTWAPNIWMGVTIEDQDACYRTKHLQQVRSKVRFISCEPLLESLPNLSLDGIHWVIVGGESGPGARPMKKEWVEEIRLQCCKKQVPFFFKQWGGTQKHKNGRVLNGEVVEEMPDLQPELNLL